MALNLRINFYLNKYSFLQHYLPSISIASAIYNQGKHNTTHVQKQVKRRHFTKKPRQGLYTNKPNNNAVILSPNSKLVSKFKKRSKKAKVKNIPIILSPKSQYILAIKNPKLE